VHDPVPLVASVRRWGQVEVHDGARTYFRT
jgi:hypothetical protein